MDLRVEYHPGHVWKILDDLGWSCQRPVGRARERAARPLFCNTTSNWDTIPVVAGITFHNFYSRLYKGTVKSAEVVDFLQTLLRHIPGPLLIVWDRLSAHRRGITNGGARRALMSDTAGYAPVLNPVEYIWGYGKQHSLLNVCPKDYWGWMRPHVGLSKGCDAVRG